jgi:hypothetical protein
MKYCVLMLFSFVFGLQEVPYKPDEEFTIKFNLSFKQRPARSSATVNYTETRAEYEKRTSSDLLPYLVLEVSIDSIKSSEMRIKVIRDHRETVLTKKVSKGLSFKLDIGFTDDAKDQVKGYLHTISFYDSDKNETSRIVIEFDKDGNYLVNGQKRGKI